MQNEKDVWYVTKLLEMARNQEIKIITSTITIAECIHIDPQIEPTVVVKRFYSELLTSGKSGIYLVQPIQSILNRARKLKWDEKLHLKPLDSIHVASALHHGCSEILTRDQKIASSAIQLEELGLKSVAPSDTSFIKSPYVVDDPNQKTFFDQLKAKG